MNKNHLVTDNPQNMTEAMLNYAYAKNERVYLLYGNDTEDIDLCEYVSQLIKEKTCCNLSADDIMQGYCIESGCDCEWAILYTLGVQAASLRERLKHYENLEEQGLLQTLPCKVGDMVYVDCETWGGISFVNYENIFIEKQFFIIAEVTSIIKTKKQLLIKLKAYNKNSIKPEFRKYPNSAFGKTVFLSTAAAAKTLKECKQK